MNTTISYNNSSNSKNKKSVLHKPWFWLLIILIASVAIRLSSRTQPKIPLDTGGGEENAPTFDLVSKQDNVTAAQGEKENIQNPSEEAEPQEEKIEKSKSIFHFILNINTKKYHTKECSAASKLSAEKRQDTDIEAETLQEAKGIIEEQGYDLCGICDR